MDQTLRDYSLAYIGRVASAVVVPLVASVALAIALFQTGPLQVAGFTLLVAAISLRHVAEITHPLTWFGPVFWLYSAAYPVLACFGLYDYDQLLQRALGLHAIAFAAFTVPLYMHRVRFHAQHWQENNCRLRWSVALAGALLLLPIILLLLLQIARLGAGSKRELMESGSAVVGIMAVLLLLLTFLLTVLIVLSLRLRRSLWVPSGIAVAIFLPLILLAGERDYLLRFMVVAVLVWWDFHRRPRAGTLVVLGVVVLFALPLLNSLKSAALSGGASYQFELAATFGQEFRVMTQNTRIVLQTNVQELLGTPFAALMMDLKRALLPQTLGFKVMNTSTWFNEVVLFDIQSGRGFSLVATGFLSGGVAGVIALYATLGLIYRWLYSSRSRTYIHMVVFALAAPLLMYVQRSDLSFLIGPAIRAILMPAVIYMLAVEAFRRFASLR